MPYRDTWATCEKCGKQFIFTVEEQRQLTDSGLEAQPSQCPDCQGRVSPSPRQRKVVLAPEQPKIDLAPGQHQGIVKWYDVDKKYGFITQRIGEDVFFHRDGLAPGERPHFPDGTPVTYRVEQSQKGPKAVDVARINAPGQ